MPLATVEVAAVCDRDVDEVRPELSRCASFVPWAATGTGRVLHEDALASRLPCSPCRVHRPRARPRGGRGPEGHLRPRGTRGARHLWHPRRVRREHRLGGPGRARGGAGDRRGHRRDRRPVRGGGPVRGVHGRAVRRLGEGPCGRALRMLRRARADQPRLRRPRRAAGRRFAVLPMLDRRPLTTDEWLAVGLGFALVSVVALAVAVLALARELGLAADVDRAAGRARDRQRGPGGRRAHGPGGGLRRRARGRRARPRGLHLRGLPRLPRPSAGGQPLRARPGIAVRRASTKSTTRGAWAMADVPGQPVRRRPRRGRHRTRQGYVQHGAQLESVLAAAERRRGR